MVLQGNSSEGRVLVLMGRDLKAFPARTFCNVMVPWLPEPKELTCCLRGLASCKTKQQKWLMLDKQLSAGQGESAPLSLLERMCTGRTELVGWVRDRDGEREQRVWGWGGQTWPSRTKGTSPNEWSESHKLDGELESESKPWLPKTEQAGHRTMLWTSWHLPCLFFFKNFFDGDHF